MTFSKKMHQLKSVYNRLRKRCSNEHVKMNSGLVLPSDDQDKYDDNMGSIKRSLDDEYKISSSLLGDGGNGLVYAAKRKADREQVVVKQLRNKGRGTPREIAILKKLEGMKGVCKMIDWFESEHTYSIVMEKSENAVDLFDFITSRNNRVDLATSMTIFKNLFNTVLALDAENLVHGDLKPENILVNTKTLETTLIDFDSCVKPFKSGKPRSGTLLFYPPEWFAGECDSELMTIWSLGLTLSCMLFGDIPFTIEEEIIESEISFDNVTDENVKELLQGLLHRDPQCRYTFKDLKTHLHM